MSRTRIVRASRAASFAVSGYRRGVQQDLQDHVPRLCDPNLADPALHGPARTRTRGPVRSSAVQNHVPGLVRGGNLAGPTIRGVARSKTTSGDWYATRHAPFGGFHAHIHGWGGVRTRWITRGSAYQSVHADMGNTRLTDPIDGTCDPPSRPPRPVTRDP